MLNAVTKIKSEYSFRDMIVKAVGNFDNDNGIIIVSTSDSLRTFVTPMEYMSPAYFDMIDFCREMAGDNHKVVIVNAYEGLEDAEKERYETNEQV